MKTRHWLVSVFSFGVLVSAALGVFAQSGGLPSRPRLVAVGVGNDAVTTGNGIVHVSGASPELDLNRFSGTASRWEAYLPAGSTQLRLAQATVDRFTFTAAGDLALTTLNSVAPSDFARLSQANTWAGIQTISSAGGTSYLLERDTSAVADEKNYGVQSSGGHYFGFTLSDALGSPTTWLDVDRTGNTVSSIGLSATAITLNGVDVTPSSTTFTLDYTNDFTGTVQQSARCYRIGNAVTITAAAAATGTSNQVSFDSVSTDVPAACRPSTSTAFGPNVGASNNSASATAMIEISTGGQVFVNRCGAVTGTCDGGSWTNTGTKGVDGWSVTFVR